MDEDLITIGLAKYHFFLSFNRLLWTDDLGLVRGVGLSLFLLRRLLTDDLSDHALEILLLIVVTLAHLVVLNMVLITYDHG